MTTPWQEWLLAKIKGHRPSSANALALAWGVPSSYIARWKAGQLPERYRIPILAERSSTPVEELERIVSESETIKSEQRRLRLQDATQLLCSASRKPLAKAHGGAVPARLQRSAA